MKGGGLINRVGNGMYTMLYYDSNLVGFFATNQQAWLFFVNVGCHCADPSLWPGFVSLVSVVITNDNGQDSLEVVTFQGFELEKNKKEYTGVITYDPKILENMQPLVEKDWAESVTK